MKKYQVFSMASNVPIRSPPIAMNFTQSTSVRCQGTRCLLQHFICTPDYADLFSPALDLTLLTPTHLMSSDRDICTSQCQPRVLGELVSERSDLVKTHRWLKGRIHVCQNYSAGAERLERHENVLFLTCERCLSNRSPQRQRPSGNCSRTN